VLAAPVRSRPLAAGDLLSVTALPAGRGRAVVEVAGELDTYTAPLLEACVRGQLVRPGLRALVVDLSQVSFLGAAGLAVLARAQHTCRERGAGFVVRGEPHSLVSRVVRRAGLTGRPPGPGYDAA
jgi:anti-sigma B factor antagonist